MGDTPANLYQFDWGSVFDCVTFDSFNSYFQNSVLKSKDAGIYDARLDTNISFILLREIYWKLIEFLFFTKQMQSL